MGRLKSYFWSAMSICLTRIEEFSTLCSTDTVLGYMFLHFYDDSSMTRINFELELLLKDPFSKSWRRERVHILMRPLIRWRATFWVAWRKITIELASLRHAQVRYLGWVLFDSRSCSPHTLFVSCNRLLTWANHTKKKGHYSSQKCYRKRGRKS